MKATIQLAAPARRDKVVILSSINLVTARSSRRSSAVCSLLARAKSKATPANINMAATFVAGIAGAVGFIIDNGTLIAAAAIVATATIFFGSSLAQKGGAK